MLNSPQALWLNVSPAFTKLDRPLLKTLSQQTDIAQWQYQQSPDEPLSLEIALTLLHDYLKHNSQPIHLLGHSTAGLLALLYARRYPERVRSLTLLSVGVHPAVDWQAHYYTQLQLLPCPRETLLTQTVYHLFGRQCPHRTREFRKMLDQDLQCSLSPHNLYQRASYFPHGAPVPLLVCGGQNDTIIDPNLLQGWQTWLKEGDRLWQCPNGRYFFHYCYPEMVSQQISQFWDALTESAYVSIPGVL
ncbi:MAG: alpha/beta hydrolase [Oculatellaceae cyanobacterium Prado106]|jgi:pimeloyl-ACP methyl ester carboxylesterase|nr:alpha/beta hydrolase [Oculatellaceae cyanobacterium Prado106]